MFETEKVVSNIKFELADVQLLLKRVVHEKEDFVFVGDCVYFDSETFAPSCVVGHVFAEIGVPAEIFVDAVINSVNCNALCPDLMRLGFEFSKEAILYLNLAQAIQDSGKAWGTALVEADVWAERVMNERSEQ